MRLPEKLVVRLQSSSSASLDGIIVQLKVFAGRKNPWYVLFPKTDEIGEAQLTRTDFIGQFTDHWRDALMDYDGSIESAAPVVEVSLFDPTWSLQNEGLALAWPLLEHERTKWSSRAEEYVHRTTCRNQNFVANPKSLDIEHNHVVELQVSPRNSETGDA